MNSIVVYFSQTGNTKKVALSIRDAIKSSAGSCDIVKSEKVDISALNHYDLIGIGCPTFIREEPYNISLLIRKMRPLQGKHCFVFSTHGGHPGNVLPSMAAKLRRQGLKVIGGFDCDGSDRMPHFTKPWWTDGHPDGIDLKDAWNFGSEMAERSRRLSQGEKISLPGLPYLRDPMHETYHKKTGMNRPLSRGFELKMNLDNTKCRYPKCRLCMDSCPVNAIDLSVRPVIFRKGCISCYFCELICPTGAIAFDAQSLEAKRKAVIESLYRRNYPDFFEKAKTELLDNRSTLYRMLVDKVEIGNI